MKILIIHNNYGKYSGEEAVVEAQIKLFLDNGHQVITYFRSSEEIEQISYGKLKAFFSGIYSTYSIQHVKELIQKELPDLVHVHNLYPLISPAILPVIKKMGIPIVMTVHNYRLLCPNGLFFHHGQICEKCTESFKEVNCIIHNCEGSLFKSTGYAIRNLWARINKYYKDYVDIFLCLTEFQKNKLIKNKFPIERCKVLPNFYEKEIREFNYEISEKNYLAFTGRISPEKGISILLDAAKQLPNIPFRLAGRINTDYMNKLKIPDNVFFLGMLNSDELSDFYKGARFLVLPSIWYEGFPMVLPEAMAHGLPLIVPNIGGFPEIAEENVNALLFENGNFNSLALQIDKLWQDPELSAILAVNSYSKLLSNYTSQVYYNQLLHIYRQLLKKTRYSTQYKTNFR
jgi:glycosyltransferase involved in cell wall biosynthesis